MLGPAVLERIANEVKVSAGQVAGAVALLDAGDTIPFIARYRKDATGNLDEARLEAIQDLNHYHIALEQRRKAALENIEGQGKLTDALRDAILACTDKASLEDIYVRFKRKRATRSALARAKGLGPLADFIRTEPDGALEAEAARYIDPAKGVSTPAEAIEGARDIIADDIAEHAAIRAVVRERLSRAGKLRAHSTKSSEDQKSKYAAFFEHAELLSKVPSQRLLAMLRGNREGALRLELQIDDDSVKREIVERMSAKPESACGAVVAEAVGDAFDRLLRPTTESEVLDEARRAAEDGTIRALRKNVRELLMSPPSGPIVVMGVSPGNRSGNQLAVVGERGEPIGFASVHPGDPAKRNDARAVLQDLARRLKVRAVAIGSGSGSREAMSFVRECVEGLQEPRPFVALVSEAGVSVYVNSQVAQEDLPDLDVSLRGAVSIARRLQDPLAELVKVEPRSICVGNHQHDVNQKRLREALHETVTQCVNRVGADVNTSSVSLLRYISGIQYGTAQNLVEMRRQNGGFKSREQLQKVPGIGAKVYLQCAGFLRIQGGENPLDATGVHPEAYGVVAKMAESAGVTVAELIGNKEKLSGLSPDAFVTEAVGRAAVEDILRELAAPARDPRERFVPVQFDARIRSVRDVESGQVLPGVVTNVTDFGAFVDIGVGHDGLVHLSELTHRYVRDPREVVRVGDGVQVKVISVDKAAPRLSFSMKATEAAPPPRRRPRKPEPRTAQPAEGRPKEARAARPESRRDGGKTRDRGRSGDRKKRRDRAPVARAGSGRETPKEAPLNTQLADQLAELRERLKAG